MTVTRAAWTSTAGAAMIVAVPSDRRDARIMSSLGVFPLIARQLPR